jgi:hypothetical protein
LHLLKRLFLDIRFPLVALDDLIDDHWQRAAAFGSHVP